MAKLSRKLGSTSQIFQIFIRDSSSTTGQGLAAIAFGTAGLTAYYHRDTDTTPTVISLGTMTLGVFTSSGFIKIDDTNMKGAYQFCPPNAALASGASSVMIQLFGATNMAPVILEIDLDAQADVTAWNGTAVSAPATAGIPEVNIKNINNVAASSVTTVNANQGTTQPINFTGTAASALVKGDTLDWNSTAVATPATAGIPEVNVKNITNVAQTGRDIGASVLLSAGIGTGQLDFTSGVVKANFVQILATALTETAGQLAAGFKQWFNVATPTGTVNSIPNVVAGATSGLAVVGSNMGTVTSVSGAVGSVTGNVGGNVVGTVASVVGSVASVTGNVAGNVTGSVGSVIGAVGSVTGAVGSVTGNVGGNVTGSVGSVVGAVGSVTGNVGGNVTGSVGSVVGTVGSVTGAVGSVIGNVGGSAASVVGAVGSVTGNVSGNVTGSVGSVLGAVGSVTGNVSGSVASVAAITTSGGIVSADIKKVNAVTVNGDGNATPWGP